MTDKGQNLSFLYATMQVKRKERLEVVMPFRVESFKAEPKQIHGASLWLGKALAPHEVRQVIQNNEVGYTEVRVSLNKNDTLTREEIATALEKIGFTLIAEVAAAS